MVNILFDFAYHDNILLFFLITQNNATFLEICYSKIFKIDFLKKPFADYFELFAQ